MVYGAIAQSIGQIAGTIVRSIARYNRYESKIFDSAYRGFPRGVGRGVRHGYVAGSVGGSLINQQDPRKDNGILSPQLDETPSGQFNKAYRRPTRRRYRRYSNKCRPRYRYRKSRRNGYF